MVSIKTVEKNCKWKFAEYDFKASGAIGPNEPMSENFKKYPYASLIRESIQNSLDVATGVGPVVIKYSLKGINPSNFPNFMDIRRHIKGCIDFYPNIEKATSVYKPMLEYIDLIQKPTKKLYYIKISDHNTTGMSIGKGYHDTSSRFFAFVRAAGLSSQKSNNAGGSFGFGKAAYFYLSSLRTLIISTKTIENNYYFEGVTSLCTHKYKDKDYQNLGYYDNNDGLPVSDYESIPSRFQRKDEDGNEIGPGTDIYIMGIDLEEKTKEDIYEDMIKAVLRNFWLAIHEKKLIVEIENTTIDNNNLLELMDLHFSDDEDEKNKTLYNPKPYYLSVINCDNDKRHRKYEINIKDEYHNYGSFVLFLHKTKSAYDRILYMRMPRMLVRIRHKNTSKGYYGVLVCCGEYADELLRKSENPAHNEWDTNNLSGADKQYRKQVAFLINKIEAFVTESIDDLFRNSNNQSLGIRGLDNFLYIPTAVEDLDEEDYVQETFLAKPTGELKDDGTSKTTIITKDNISESKHGIPQQGLLALPTITKVRKDNKGGILSGHSSRRKNSTGGKPGSRKIDGRNTENNEGVEGSFLREIRVRYRTFAQSMNNEIFHTIIIYSEQEVESGRIDILIGGEDADEKIKIIESSTGQTRDNSIINIPIHVGKNTFSIKFADNQKHALKLDAYEIK